MRPRRFYFIAIVLVTGMLLLQSISPAWLAQAAAGARVNALQANCSTGVKIMPTGDSITRGSGSVGVNGYRKPLYLALSGTPYSYVVDFVGAASAGDFTETQHNGYSGYHAKDDTLADIYDNIFNWLDANHTDIILLHIGTNDITENTYAANEIGQILDEINRYEADSTANPGGGKVHVIVALIINRVSFSAVTSSYNNDVKSLVISRSATDEVSWVDMENIPGFVYSSSAGGDMNDNLHPNDSGYAKMANVWLPEIVRLCSGAPTVATPENQNDAENDSPSLQIEASDPDIPLAYDDNGTLPPGLSINASTGLIGGTLTYDAAANSPYIVEITVSDNDPGSDDTTVSFQWTVTNTNRAPEVDQPLDQSSEEGQTIDPPLPLVASDPDNNGFSFEVENLPPGLSINTANGEISGTIEYGANTGAPYTVTITVTDDDPSNPLSNEVQFTWTVTDTNRAPVVDPLNDRSNKEGTFVSFTVKASDPDSDPVTFNINGLPDGLVYDPATGLISGTLGYNSHGIHTVTVTAIDDGAPPLESAEETFTWTVIDVNVQPAITKPEPQASAEGQAVSLQIQASDPDGDSLSFTATGLPAVLSISESGLIYGVIDYTAASGNPYSVRVMVSDGSLSASQTFTWTVADAEPPETFVYLPIVLE